MDAEPLFVVSVNSTRELDRGGRRARRLDGVNPPTPREGNRLWRPYDELRPDPPEPGSPLVIGWEVVGDLWRSTVTSQVVGTFPHDPTDGPFSWARDPTDHGRSPLGLVVVEDSELFTPNATCAHVLANLANVGLSCGEPREPGPLWQLLPVEGKGHRPLAAIEAFGFRLAVGDHDMVERLFGALVRLPDDGNLPAAALAAACDAGWTPTARSTAGRPSPRHEGRQPEGSPRT